VLLPTGHPLADGPVRLRDLRDECWCASEDSYVRGIVARIAESIDLDMRIVFESEDFRAIGSAVEVGLGIALAPAMTDLRGLDLAVQPLVEPTLIRTVFAAVRRGSANTPAIRAVLEALTDAADAASERP
jgi:DNA-binding transcriptional LysR family regulator